MDVSLPIGVLIHGEIVHQTKVSVDDPPLAPATRDRYQSILDAQLRHAQRAIALVGQKADELNARATTDGELEPVGIDMSPSLVVLVDDDDSVRESVPDLLRELGFEARTFESASAFLASDCIPDVACLVLDIFMPGMKGSELHVELNERGYRIPTVFISARADEAARSHIVDAAITPIVSKPFSETALRDAIAAALRSH
jgi:CheY-like chemotaxis protein